MATVKGFWSYAHIDDDTDGGRITRIARDLVAEYAMITAEEMELFLDRDKLEWGDEWRPKIDTKIAEGAFFIPIITPRYFQSTECRRELIYFARKATALGVSELVLPIRYIDFPALYADPSEDEAIILARSFQWEDWTELRFSAPDSPEYRRAIAKLANRLATASALTETITVNESAEGEASYDDDDAPGYLDKLAKTEETLPAWASTVDGITVEIAQVGDIMRAAVEEVEAGESRGKGFAARINVARKVAEQLDEPVSNFQTLAKDFASQLQDIDAGIRVVIERAPDEIRENPESLGTISSFIAELRDLIDKTEEGLGYAQAMSDAIAPLEQQSRNLRPVARRLRQALRVMLDGRDIILAWTPLLDQLPPPIGNERALAPH